MITTQQKHIQHSQLQRQQRQEFNITSGRKQTTRREEDSSSYSSNSFSHGSDHCLGIRMEFPQGLVRRHSRAPLQPEHWIGNGKIFVDNTGDQCKKMLPKGTPPASFETRTTGQSLAIRPQHQYRSSNVARKYENKVRSPPISLSPEQKQLQELYMDARLHEAVVARVTSPSDLEKMTYTLPAAKIAPSPPRLPKRKPVVGGGWFRAHQQNTCPPSREGGGAKATRASTAAALILSQAEPTHDYDCQPKADKRAFPRNSRSVDSRKKPGWKSLLSRKLVPRSSILVAPFEI